MAHQGSPYQYLENFKKWIREGEHLKKGIPFEEFWTYPYELINAFISVQAGKGLLSPCNQVLVIEPKISSCMKRRPYCRLSATAFTSLKC